MPRIALPVLVALCLSSLFLSAPAVDAQTAPFTVRSSEKIDALLLLDALGKAHPQSGAYPALDQEWLPRVEADAAAKEGYQTWRGHGIGLAYLFSDVGGDTLADLLAALAKTDETLAAVEKTIDEPAYRKTFEQLKTHHAALTGFLGFFARSGFAEGWRKSSGAVLDPELARARAALAKVDGAKWQAALAPFLGAAAAEPVEVVVSGYSGSVNFRLKGARVAIAAVHGVDADLSVLHELCHRMNPSEKTLAPLRALAAADPFYGTAWRRICTELLEGEEEEYVLAAALHAGVQAGLLTRKEALRQIKFACPSAVGAMPPDQAGAPVAGIVFAELTRVAPTAGFDYDALLEGLHAQGKIKAGAVTAEYEGALKEILGIAGVQFSLREGKVMVVRAIVGYPAKEAGVADGDEVTAVGGVPVDGSIDRMMELLAGARGQERSLTLKRGPQTLEIKFALR